VDFDDQKNEVVERRKKSVELFSNKGKTERECWVVKTFLDIIGKPYSSDDIIIPEDEPPDINFQDCRFEIMEDMAPNRRRHDEYKERLRKAENATNMAEPQETERWNQEALSLSEVVRIAAEKLEEKKGKKYSKDVKLDLDVLIYVNMSKYTTVDDEDFILTEPTPTSFNEWRSVSLIVNSKRACVAFAQENAPALIRNAVGTHIH